MNNEGDDWEELRDLWQRLKHSRLSEGDVFDDLAQHRIGSSIATEATSSPERVITLKRIRQTEAYYLRQAADAQAHAHRALSLDDREAWLALAHNWLKLLSSLKEQRFADAVGRRSTGQSASKRSH